MRGVCGILVFFGDHAYLDYFLAWLLQPMAQAPASSSCAASSSCLSNHHISFDHAFRPLQQLYTTILDL